jgi:hypothetical protein
MIRLDRSAEEAQVMRTVVALAAGLCLALATTPAPAQSAKGRDYGGPLYVGPNFEKGGQHAPPDYGSSKPNKERAAPKRAKPERSVSKGKAAKEANTEKGSADEKSSAVSSGSAPASDGDAEASPKADTDPGATAGATAQPTTCKRFDATSGQTITVPCE